MEKKKSNLLLVTAFCLYINYFIHGMGAVILAQNTSYLQGMWGFEVGSSVGIAAVLKVASALGLGRLVLYPFTGILSDKLGRRLCILIGIVSYIIFFIAILFTPSSSVAFWVALFAGFANAFLDSGVIPAVMEILPESTGVASILTKLSVSIGQLVIPHMVAYFGGIGNFKLSFYICAIALAINGIFLLRLPFATQDNESKENKEEVSSTVTVKSNFFVEGIALIIMGFTSTATFNTFANVNKSFGLALGMTEKAAGSIQSAYAMGSIFAVIITAVLIKKIIKPVRFLVIYPLASAVVLFAMYVIKNSNFAIVGGFLVGFTAAGGVLQLVVSTMTDLFSGSKGKLTGIIMISSGIASYATNYLAGVVTEYFGVQLTLIMAAIIALVGTFLALVVNSRYNTLMKEAKQ